MANIRFDDPENLADPSRIFLDLVMDLQLLDYARRYFERKGDSGSLQRAREIRKFYKHTIENYVYIVRAVIPEDVVRSHTKLLFAR